MYPRIPWELVTDPLESAEHTLGTVGLGEFRASRVCAMAQTVSRCPSIAGAEFSQLLM